MVRSSFFHLDLQLHRCLMHTQVLMAYKEIHEQRIIYRDLKPENLVLDSNGHCIVIDFGLAKRADRWVYIHTHWFQLFIKKLSNQSNIVEPISLLSRIISRPTHTCKQNMTFVFNIYIMIMQKAEFLFIVLFYDTANKFVERRITLLQK